MSLEGYLPILCSQIGCLIAVSHSASKPQIDMGN